MTDQVFDSLIDRCLSALLPWVEQEAIQSSPAGSIHLKNALGLARDALRHLRSRHFRSFAEERCLAEVCRSLEKTLKDLRRN